jgi:hypothetical protein
VHPAASGGVLLELVEHMSAVEGAAKED